MPFRSLLAAVLAGVLASPGRAGTPDTTAVAPPPRVPGEASNADLPSPSAASIFELPGIAPSTAHLAAYADFTEASDALSLAFMNRLLFGGFIDAELKDDAMSRLDAFGNRVGYRFRTGVKGRWTVGPGVEILARAGYRYQQDVAFSRDLFELLFYGNAPLAGREASLDGLAVRYVVNQHLDLGAGYTVNGAWTWRFAACAGVVQGLSQAQADVQGTFYTEADGTRLDLVAAGELRNSDNRAPRFTSFNGLGWQAGGQVAASGRAGSIELRVIAEAEDFGRARWDRPGFTYAVDSAWTFDGLSVDQLADLTAEPLSGETDSLLDYLGISAEEGAYVAPLPGLWRIRIGGEQDGWGLSAGVEGRPGTNARPLAWLTGSRTFAKADLAAGLMLAYGGWGGFQVGADLGWQPANAFSLRLGASNVLTWLAPKSMTGGTVWLGLAAHL